jgi:hypothetical protein
MQEREIKYVTDPDSRNRTTELRILIFSGFQYTKKVFFFVAFQLQYCTEVRVCSVLIS